MRKKLVGLSSLILLFSFLCAIPVIAQEGVTTRVSIASDGTQGNSRSGSNIGNNQISADGRFVVFESEATNLVIDNPVISPYGMPLGIYLHDRQTGQTSAVLNIDTALPELVANPQISADGNIIAFFQIMVDTQTGQPEQQIVVYSRQTEDYVTRLDVPFMVEEKDENEEDFMGPLAAILSATNFSLSSNARYIVYNVFFPAEDNSTDSYSQLFVHDRVLSQTTPISNSSHQVYELHHDISDDGRYIAYKSNQNVFIHDRQTQIDRLVSIATDGTQANKNSGEHVVSISDDGRYVLFDSMATNLDDITGFTGNYFEGIFLHDTQTSETSLLSRRTDGSAGNIIALLGVALSGNGRYAAFYGNNLIESQGDESGIYRYDRLTNEYELISISITDEFNSNDIITKRPSLSTDGRYVSFNSEIGNLIQGDTNGKRDIFVRDTGESESYASITGQIVAEITDTPLPSILVIAYRHENDNTWQQIRTTTTNNSGVYTLNNLPDGNYRLRIVDPIANYLSEMYRDTQSFEQSQVITTQFGQLTKNINITLNKTPPYPVSLYKGSLGYDSNSKEYVARTAKNIKETFQATITCLDGSTPANVHLLVQGETGEADFTMNRVASPNVYQASFTPYLDLKNLTPPYKAVAQYACNSTPVETRPTRLELHPSNGKIVDATTNEAIEGATVTLYYIPYTKPDQNSKINGACRTTSTRVNAAEGQFGAWSSLSPSSDTIPENKQIYVAPNLQIKGSQAISPTINPQITGKNGYYGWDVAQGCWYISVAAIGYETMVSPIIGMSSAITDLDIALQKQRKK